MATHSSILAWEIPWTEEYGRPQSLGSQKNQHNLATKQQQREDTQWNKHRFFDLQTSQTSVFSFVK